jgi:PAS domain S-box-containing protein
LLPPIPSNEASRIAALRAYDILDTAEEEIFDSITRAAAAVCSTPMASLSFVDKDRQWFKSRVGISAKESSRDASFCAHAINGHELFVVEDASKDARFRDNPLVLGDPNLRFYAGMPLVTAGGLALGALCVLDTVPRRLTAEQARTLNALADSATRLLNLRRNLGVAVYAKAVDMTSDGVTISAASSTGTSIVYANESFLRFTGYQYHEAINQPCAFPAVNSCPEVARALEQASAKGQMTTAECRFRTKAGDLCWDRVSFVPYVDEKGKLVYMVAVHRDITLQKEAELQVQQLHAMRTTMATVDHVVKNFMNAAQLYSMQVASGKQIEPKTQQAFDAALENTRAQLAAIHGMPAFKDRRTPFGFSLLDHEPHADLARN